MKLKSLLLTAFLSFAITPLAMAMTGEEHYYRGYELQGWNDRAADEHYRAACNKNYLKGCEKLLSHSRYKYFDSLARSAELDSENLKLSEKACKLGNKKYCGLRQKVQRKNKIIEMAYKIKYENEEFNDWNWHTLSTAEREKLVNKARIQFEDEAKFGKEKAKQMRKEREEREEKEKKEKKEKAEAEARAKAEAEARAKAEAEARAKAEAEARAEAAQKRAKYCKTHRQECMRETFHNWGEQPQKGMDPMKRVVLDREKGCNQGNMDDCTYVAGVYLDGDYGFPKDKNKATQFYNKACQGGNYWGCLELGVLYQKGASGFEKNKQKAQQLFEKGCTLGADNPVFLRSVENYKISCP